MRFRHATKKADPVPISRRGLLRAVPAVNARIDGEYSELICQQRIDVQFADLRNIRSHLRQLDQNHRDGVLLDRRHIAVGTQ